MIILQEPLLSEYTQCPYLSNRKCRFRYFFACDLSAYELNELLIRGWRKFGMYYFKPECGECQKCIPVRVRIVDFKPTKGQRRVLRLASSIQIKYNQMEYRDEIYEVYKDHSLHRFGKETDKDDFMTTFYQNSCPSLQSEYYCDTSLFAVGFLDQSNEALSSIYFVYRSNYAHFSPGTLSVMKEIEFALSRNLKYYYLGYYIEKNRSMSYKNRFHPFEWYSWTDGIWHHENEGV